GAWPASPTRLGAGRSCARHDPGMPRSCRTGAVRFGAVAELNPQQRDVRDELLLYGQPRPTLDPELGRSLRRRAIAELTALGADCGPGGWVRVDKHRLSQAHTCTGYLRARSSEEFGWSVANVRG